MNQLEQLKQEAQQDIQKHTHYRNDDLFCKFAIAKAFEIIDKAYLAGQKSERERCLEIIEYKFPHSQENQNIINLIKSD